MLEVAAIDRTGEVRVVRDALADLGLDHRFLADCERDGSLTLDGDRIEIDAASDVIAMIAPAERRTIHRALARVLHEARHAVQRAEHLADAAIGPDQDASTALLALANEATERGDTTIAASYFLRAGSLAPDPEDRATLLYRAGDAHWNAGDYVAARVAFDAAFLGAAQPMLRADIAWQIGTLDMFERGPRHARDVFAAAAEAVEPHDVDRAAMLLVHAASTVMLSTDVVGALGYVRQACALAARGNGSSTMPAALMLAYLSLQHGDIPEFEEHFPALSRLADELTDTDIPEVDLYLQLVGMLHVYTERWDTGRLYLSTVAHRAGRRARFATVAQASATLAELCWRSGRWDEAWALATSPAVHEVTLTGARVWLKAFTAHLDAGFGRADDCRARAYAAIAEAEPMGLGTAIVWAYHGLGLLELGLGHAVAAAAHLDRVAAIMTAHQVLEPSGIWWQADHVEALIRSGRLREASLALGRFEQGAALTDLVWAQATSARCRGLLATSDDEAERAFASALAQHDRLASPFELGRTLMCRAERRVSGGCVLDAHADVAEARAIFDALGAVAWSAQASALRDSLTASEEPSIDSVLSPAERRVADAVVDGLTNREVAARLYVSEKTVEFHLHNVYRKLGVRSRTQLVRRLPTS